MGDYDALINFDPWIPHSTPGRQLSNAVFSKSLTGRETNFRAFSLFKRSLSFPTE